MRRSKKPGNDRKRAVPKAAQGGAVATTLIASFLFLSFALRLSAEIDSVASSELVESVLKPEVALMRSGEKMSSLLQEMREKQGELEKWEAELAAREQEFAQQSTALDAQIRELEAAEQRLEQAIGAAKRASENDVARLTSFYEEMKPKEAAAVFELMEPALAAGFLYSMRPERASGVLEQLSPEKSYAISVFLAGRNAN